MTDEVPTTLITYLDGYGCTAQRWGTAWRGPCGTYPDHWVDGGTVAGTTILLWSIGIAVALFLIFRRYQRYLRAVEVPNRPR